MVNKWMAYVLGRGSGDEFHVIVDEVQVLNEVTSFIPISDGSIG